MRTSKGSGLEDVFERYDKEGKGVLDAIEFATAAEDIGFGDVANDIFVEFDPDNSGTVSHGEILDQIKKQGVSKIAKKVRGACISEDPEIHD